MAGKRTPKALKDARIRIEDLRDERDALLRRVAATPGGKRASLLSRVGKLETSLGKALGRLDAAGVDPCDAEPDVPLVLLPVRIETRYTEDGASLQVRIYPDDVHVDRLDRGLADEEHKAGREYWTEVWAGDAEAERAAWTKLRGLVHDRRAAWVVEALRPLNFADRPAPGDPGPAPELPEPEPRGLGTPVAAALPDRFLVRVTQGGVANTWPGGAVAPELALGLATERDPSNLVRTDGLTLGAGMEWMVKYQDAVDKGMALTVPLDQPGEPIESVVVFGVRNSVDPVGGAADLERLLRSHRFTRGAGFVPQGTPTNNTESDRSAWQRPLEPPPPVLGMADDDPESSSSVLARALGIDAAPLRGLDHADAHDQRLAQATNTALWPSTWGTYLDRLLIVRADGPTFSDDEREGLRDFFQDHVRGRGPLPAVRLDGQPYGVLPVAAHDARWQAKDGALEPRLSDLLRRARGIFRASRGGVPRVTDAELDTALLEILGSSPQALGLRVRSVASKTTSDLAPHFIDPDGLDTPFHGDLDRVVWTALGLDPSKIAMTGSFGRTTRPLGLPLVHESDAEFIKAILDRSDPLPAVQSVLQALLGLADDRERRAIEEASPHERLGALREIAGEIADGHLLARIQRIEERVKTSPGPLPPRLVRDAKDTASKIAEQMGGESGLSLLTRFEPLRSVRGSLSEVALDPSLGADGGRTALQALGAWLRGQHRRGEFEAALRDLRGATDEERRILLCEVLDTASHRLDAWITGVVSKRLDEMRDAKQQGAMIGAYGWVENVELGKSTTAGGGFIHAPSPAQATTAGILRSAHLTHNGGSTGQGGAFAVDLTSARVRRAMALAEGIAQGQPLGALVGYRIERRLYEARLGRFVLSLRALAPLVAGKLTDRDDTLPQAAQEAVAASNVVDGLRLLALQRADIKDSLRNPPQNNPYLTASDWSYSEADDWPQIDAALNEAAASVDSLSDLMRAEAVHQLAQGNTARAAAALDASAGDAPPVEFDFVRTPPTGVAITHRLLVVAAKDAGGTAGWNRATPRATAEPSLEAWLERRLGPADKIVLGTGPDGKRIALDAAGMSALDFMHESVRRPQLEEQLRAKAPALGSEPLAEQREASWPKSAAPYLDAVEHAAALAGAFAAARPALETAFVRASAVAPGVKLPVEADLGDLHTRLAAARQTLDDLAKHPALDELAEFGIHPPVAEGVDPVEAAAAEAKRRLEAVKAILDASDHPFDAERGIAAGKAIFGEAFWILPLVSGAAAQLLRAPANPVPDGADVRGFLHDAASVRAGVGAYTEALLIADATGADPRPTVAQHTGGEAALTTRLPWVGGPFDSADLAGAGPVTTMVFDSPTPLAAATVLCGLVLDEWVEAVPRWQWRKTEAGDEVHELMQTTGVAVNANAAGARAPQAILLAVSPDGQRWTTDALAATLDDARELAQLRGVTLERAAWLGRVLPALLEQSWSLQGEKTLDITRILFDLSRPEHMIPFVREAGGG